MQPIRAKDRNKLIHLAAISALLVGAATIAAPQVEAWGSWSSWKSPGTPSYCYATDQAGDEIWGVSSVSTNALQTLVATDMTDECFLRTEAAGKDSAGVIFTEKARTRSATSGPNSQTASVTTPRNVAKHRCRVEDDSSVQVCTHY